MEKIITTRSLFITKNQHVPCMRCFLLWRFAEKQEEKNQNFRSMIFDYEEKEVMVLINIERQFDRHDDEFFVKIGMCVRRFF